MIFDIDLGPKDLRELIESLFFNASERWCFGLSRLGARANDLRPSEWSGSAFRYRDSKCQGFADPRASEPDA